MNTPHFTANSKDVRNGSIFFHCSDNPAYLNEAIANGASQIYMKPQDNVQLSVPVVFINTVKKEYAKACRNLYPLQPDYCVGVTGTNGKSSTVHFLKQLWEYHGFNAASLGTLGIDATIPLDIKIPSLTTLDPLSFHRTLHQLKEVGIDYLGFEASSHGLDQYRCHFVKTCAAGFTNLSQDHLDYHETMDDYFDAKVKLFTEILDSKGQAVINADCPYGQKLIKICQDKNIPTLLYSMKDSQALLYAKIINFTQTGTRIHLFLHGHDMEIDFPVVGDFQVSNLLCALGLFLATTNQTTITQDALESLTAPKGRMDYVGSTISKGSVYVDFAHTPDALQRALMTLRHHTMSRLYVIFGCGGDRDKEKRPIMGAIAQKYADTVIITDDNPRTEKPDDIRNQIQQGCMDAIIIEDREKAIAHGIALLKEGDILLIAGKGHEQGQIVGNTTLPFCDKNSAELYL